MAPTIDSPGRTSIQQQLAERLGEVPFLWRLAHRGLEWRTKLYRAHALRRPARITGYLAVHEVRKLRIGAKEHTDPGWLAADIAPARRDVVYLDATKRFPFPEASFDVISCEHMIEHIPYPAACRMVAECHRVLKPGGVLRVGTPDVDHFRLVVEEARRDPVVFDYVRWQNATRWSNDPDVPRPEDIPDGLEEGAAFVLNREMREWGHTFLYNAALLRHVLVSAGFAEVVQLPPQESTSPLLEGTDRHPDEVGEAFNGFESLVMEATKA